MKSWAERDLDNQNLRLFLIAIITLGLLPFIGELPAWLMACAGALMVWNFLTLVPAIKFIPRHTPRWLRNTLGLIATAAVFAQYRTLAGQDAATALLVLLAGFKILESVRYRDAMILIFVAYFLLMDAALFSQSLSMTVFLIVDLMVITILLFYLHGRDRLLSIRSLKAVGKVLTIALPLAIVMFFLFPRFSAELFKISAPESGTSGFSDDLNPGDLESLAKSDVLAFRATFLKTTPRLDQFYWRGGVLTKSEGLKWSRPPSRSFRAIQAPINPEADITQEIVLEPIFKKFIFGLDIPTSIVSGNTRAHFAFPREGTIFERDTDTTARVLYTVHSQPENGIPVVNELSHDERAADLEAPKMTDRDRALVASFKSPGADARTLAERVLKFYKSEHFRYTLEPGAIHHLDQFLFEKKVGFCEHYAASFSTIMRWLGVPSRVVIGFEGGSFNRLGGYYIVRSLDAHAWSEIWSENESRWVRIDPTARIAPMRITLGSDYYNADPSLLQAGLTREQYEDSIAAHFLSRWISRSRLTFDLVSSRWNSFMLRYDFDYQTEILRKLGINGSSRAILFLWFFLAAGVMLVLGQLWLKRPLVNDDPVLRAYNEICDAFARKGLARQPNEGPLDYSKRLAARWPKARAQTDALLREFMILRYETVSDSASNNQVPQLFQRAQAWKKQATRLLRTTQLFEE